MLSTQSFKEIRQWMLQNARPLELARWRFHFEQGSKEDVLKVLSAYQNEDGGFGHAVEADNWNPDSSPYSTGVAFEVFRELGIYNPRQYLVEKAFRFLDDTAFFTETGWPFTIPTNSDHPHAPWWTYSEENNAQNGYHATGGLVGFILRCGDVESSLYRKALAVADGMLDKLRRAGTLDVHEIGVYGILLKDIQAAGLTGRFDSAYLYEQVSGLVNRSIERNPDEWPRYSMRPSQYIDSPESPFYHGNEAIVETEMDYILASRHANGVWGISWQWAEYPREFAIAERWWQGYWAIRNTLLLRAFHRLDEAMNNAEGKGFAVKENVAVYYTKDMDRAVKWFQDVIGWHGKVIDRNEKGEGVYGFVADSPQEQIMSRAKPFQGFHLWYGDPSDKTIALVQVQGIESFHRSVKRNGWDRISGIHPSGASSQTCDITTPDGSTLMVFT